MKSKCKTTNSRVATRSEMQLSCELCSTTCQMPTYALMAAEITNSGHGENDQVRSNANGSEHTREGCFAKDRWYQTNKRSGKGKKSKKGKKGQGKGTKQYPRMVTPRRKVLARTMAKLVTLRVNVRRRKSLTMQIPVVEVMCIA